MKDILERIAESSYTEGSHELCCRLTDCAHEIREMRDILKIIANERFIPEEWERLTARVKAALEEKK